MGTWLSLFSYQIPEKQVKEPEEKKICKLIIILDEKDSSGSHLFKYCNRPVYSEDSGLCKIHHMK